jgi:hypothetical protein
MLKRLAALLLVLGLAAPASAGFILEGSTDSLEVVTTTTAQIDYQASWSNVTATALTTPGTTKGAITTATTTTVIAAPAASNFRHLRALSLMNVSTTAANTVTVQVDVSATNRLVVKATLAAGEYLLVDETGKATIYAATGMPRIQDDDARGFNGTTYGYMKNGLAKDAAGYAVSNASTAGTPGAYTLGTPGVNGTATDCSVSTSGADPRGALEAGAHVLTDPASGSLYLTQATFSTSTAQVVQLVDVLWWNTGLVVTTGAQAITPGTLAARDTNGTANGDNIQVALLVASTLGNAAAIANSTITYTDSDGNAGNTGTFVATVGLQLPATALIGTWVPFTLAAGDRGVRSIQSFNTGTTYTSGTFSLVQFRPLAYIPQTVSNNAAPMHPIMAMIPGVKLWPNTCIWTNTQGPSATGSLDMGTYMIMER